MEIRVLSRKTAEQALREDRVIGNIKAMISIADAYPYTEKAPYGTARVPRVLRLVFDDTTCSRWHHSAPHEKDIKRIVDFAQSLQNEPGILLIHCEAGISRSSAAGIICKTIWLGLGHDADAIIDIYTNNPIAWPNTLMVEYADKILEKNGALIKAIDDNPDAEIWLDQMKKLQDTNNTKRGSNE